MGTSKKLFLLISFTSILGTSQSWSQGAIMWPYPIHQMPLANVGTTSGQYYDPQFSPVSNDWLSFEVDREGARALYVLDLKHQRRYDVSVGKKPAADENILEQSGTQSNTFAGELAWCPVKINGKQWFAFVWSSGANEDIYLGNTDELVTGSSNFYRITNDPLIDDDPHWSPDGTQLIFTSRRSGRSDLYRITNVPELIKAMLQDVAGDRAVVGELVNNGKWIERTTDSPFEEIFPAWSPDGGYVTYTLVTLGSGDSSGSQLMVKEIAGGKTIKLYDEKSRILRNPSFSPDGRFIACYDAGSRQEETVDLVVFQLTFSAGKISGAHVRWTKDNVKKFEEVKSRVHGGPYWGTDGSLYFLNEKRSQKNSIVQIPQQSFLQSGKPATKTFILVGEKSKGNIEPNIRDLDFTRLGEQEPTLVVAVQQGNLFGIYYDTLSVTAPTLQSPLVVSLTSGFLRYQGDARDSGFTSCTELSLRYNLSDQFYVTGSAGFGNIQGYDVDANGARRSFVSLLYYLNVMPTVSVVRTGPFELLAEGGVGGGYLNSKRTTTKGMKLLFPLQLEANFSVMPNLTFVLRGGYTFTSGDLDGLRSQGKQDNYCVMAFGINNAVLLPLGGR